MCHRSDCTGCNRNNCCICIFVFVYCVENTRLGDRSFSAAAPRLWNSLPKRHLKTFFAWRCITPSLLFLCRVQILLLTYLLNTQATEHLQGNSTGLHYTIFSIIMQYADSTHRTCVESLTDRLPCPAWHSSSILVRSTAIESPTCHRGVG